MDFANRKIEEFDKEARIRQKSAKLRSVIRNTFSATQTSNSRDENEKRISSAADYSAEVQKYFLNESDNCDENSEPRNRPPREEPRARQPKQKPKTAQPAQTLPSAGPPFQGRVPLSGDPQLKKAFKKNQRGKKGERPLWAMSKADFQKLEEKEENEVFDFIDNLDFADFSNKMTEGQSTPRLAEADRNFTESADSNLRQAQRSLAGSDKENIQEQLERYFIEDPPRRNEFFYENADERSFQAGRMFASSDNTSIASEEKLKRVVSSIIFKQPNVG